MAEGWCAFSERLLRNGRGGLGWRSTAEDHTIKTFYERRGMSETSTPETPPAEPEPTKPDEDEAENEGEPEEDEASE